MTQAYIVFIKDRTISQGELDKYKAMVGKSFEGRQVTFHAVYGAHEVLEGPSAEGVVILEFPDMKEARDWYSGPAYGEARQHRFKGAEYRAILVEGKLAT